MTIEVSLEKIKVKRKAYINAKRDEAMAAGVEYNGVIFDSDFISQANMARVHTGVNDSWPLPEGFTWRSADNQDIPFTTEDVNNLAHIMLDNGNSIYKDSWVKKKAIDDATTQTEIEAIDW